MAHTTTSFNEGKRRPLTFAEAAAYLNTTVRHIQRLWTERKIAGYKVGRKVRIDPDSLDQYLIENRRGQR